MPNRIFRDEYTVIRGLLPGTNWPWIITNACEVIRMVTFPEELENQ